MDFFEFSKFFLRNLLLHPYKSWFFLVILYISITIPLIPPVDN